jgi:hypothetical protein
VRRSQRASGIFSATALGVILPQTQEEDGADNDQEQVEEVDYVALLKGDPEPTVLFKKLNGLYHQSRVQFNVRDNCTRDVGTAYLRIDADLQAAVRHEMALGNHSDAVKGKARNPEPRKSPSPFM